MDNRKFNHVKDNAFYRLVVVPNGEQPEDVKRAEQSVMFDFFPNEYFEDESGCYRFNSHIEKWHYINDSACGMVLQYRDVWGEK